MQDGGHTSGNVEVGCRTIIGTDPVATSISKDDAEEDQAGCGVEDSASAAT